MIKTILKYWYLIVILLTALLVNENSIQWALAIKVGGHSLGSGFEDAFKHFSILGYLFFTAFRLIPYLALCVILFVLSITKLKDYVIPVFTGGFLGILGMVVWGSWVSLRPFYTDQHVSSTTAIAFLIIPFYAVMTGQAGVILFAALYTPFRIIYRKKQKKAEDTKSSESIKIGEN